MALFGILSTWAAVKAGIMLYFDHDCDKLGLTLEMCEHIFFCIGYLALGIDEDMMLSFALPNCGLHFVLTMLLVGRIDGRSKYY